MKNRIRVMSKNIGIIETEPRQVKLTITRFCGANKKVCYQLTQEQDRVFNYVQLSKEDLEKVLDIIKEVEDNGTDSNSS